MGLYRDETGRVLELDDAFASARGYTPLSPLERDAENAQIGEQARGEERGIVGDINAAATGFASGLTLGGSDYLLGKTLSPLERERVLAEIEAHPKLRLGGEIAGTIAGSLPSMGATPTGYLSSLAAKQVERGLEKGGAAGVGTALVAMGTEGAGQSVGQYIGHAALEDKELTAEGLTGAAGTGFAFGSAGGGAALGVVKGTVAARRMFSRVMAGQKAAQDAESAWSIASQEALEADAANVRAAEIKQENVRQAKMAALRERNAAKADAAEAALNRPAATPDVEMGIKTDARIAAPQGGMPTSVFKRPAELEGPSPLIDVGEQPAGAATSVFTPRAPGEAAPTPSTWREFVGSKMSEYMKSEGGHAGAMKRLGAEWKARGNAPVEATTALEQQLAGTKKAIDEGRVLKDIPGENAVPGSAVSPQIPPRGEPPIQPGRKQASNSINDWLAEKAAHDADMAELSAVKKIEDIKGANELRMRRQETLREIRFKMTEDLLGSSVAKEERRIAEALDEYNNARADLEGLAGRGPESNGIPEVIGGPGERQAADILDSAHEEALLRARNAADPAEGGQAIQEAHELERLLEGLQAPRLQKGDNALSARDLRGPKAEQYLEALRADIDKVKRYEEASARLAEEVGDQAHPLSSEMTKNLRGAERDAERKVFERSARAADDAADGVHVSPKQRKIDAQKKLDELTVQHQEATHELGQARAQLKVSEKAKKEALKLDAKAAREAEKASTKTGGTLGAVGGVFEIADIPGLPKPSDLPIVGPLLGLYLKYRLAKKALGGVGRVAATADARAAVMAAQTRDRIARGVDRSLGVMEKAAQKGMKLAPRIAGVLAARVYDDGRPDAKKGAPINELAATRMREIAAYVSTPGAIERDVRRELAGITDPDLIAATEKQRRAAFEYLLSTMPKLPEPSMLNPTTMLPSEQQALSFGRRMEALSDPAGVFERLGNEQDLLSLEAAEALRKVYPRLFSEAQQRVLEQVAGGRKVSARQRVQLTLLYKLPLDSALDPDNLRITQTVFERKVQQPAPAMQGAPPNPAIANPVNISQTLTPAIDRSR